MGVKKRSKSKPNTVQKRVLVPQTLSEFLCIMSPLLVPFVFNMVDNYMKNSPSEHEIRIKCMQYGFVDISSGNGVFDLSSGNGIYEKIMPLYL